MTTHDKKELIITTADDMKAEAIETLDVRAKTSVADYFVVCTGNNDRHVQAIAERVAEKLTMVKERPLRVEGEKSGWVLQDYGDVVFHVMKDDTRQFYDLESLWKNLRPDPNLEG